MRTEILPFRPVAGHFFRNLWYLRFFMLLFAAALMISSGVLLLAEGSQLDAGSGGSALCVRALGVTVEGVLLGGSQGYVPVTALGKAVTLFNSLLGYALLGILIWVIEQSLSGHRLTKSKYLVFPRE